LLLLSRGTQRIVHCGACGDDALGAVTSDTGGTIALLSRPTTRNKRTENAWRLSREDIQVPTKMHARRVKLSKAILSKKNNRLAKERVSKFYIL